MREEAHESGSERHAETSATLGSGRVPWTRVLLLLAIVGPPLWLGGVKPQIVAAFVLVAAALLVRRCLRSAAPLRVPSMWWLGVLAAALCLLQWLPLPGPLLGVLAPGLSRELAQLLAGTDVAGWSRLSVVPGQTGLELARVLALTGLFVATAQLGWRLVAGYVSLAATLVAVVGLAQKLVGATAIYGVYVPRQEVAGLGQALGSPLLTSFVNPNHQSGLLLVGLFAAAGMAADLHVRARETRGRQESERLADRAYLAVGALTIQTTALVLSMSRAALLSLVIVAPLALWLIIRAPRPVGSEPEHEQRRRVMLGLVIAAMLGVALTQGAWTQLSTLREPGTFLEKFRVAREGLALIGLSPVLGSGRGTFVDLFPLVDGAPGRIQFTHLESTPIAWLVEWGPLGGGVIVLGLAAWWWRSFAAHAGLGRRLCMCGLLALAIQSCADFSLEFLGVAAPAVALAGSLGAESTRARAWPSKRVLVATLITAPIGVAVAIVSLPGSWSERQPRDQQVLAGSAPIEPALRTSPLDPQLHLALARELATAGEWEAAEQRVGVAIRLRPSSLDAHLLAATIAATRGAALESIEHLRAGLEGVREPVPEVLIAWLIERTPEPAHLAEFAPESPEAWTALARALARSSPAHAIALARARALTHPGDPEPLRLQAALALEAQNPALALHHARLLVQLQPQDIGALTLRANARLAHHRPAQDRAAAEELEAALAGGLRDKGGGGQDVRAQAALEELLVVALLRIGDEAALDRAAQVVESLLTRRAEPNVRRRRRELAERIEAARRSPPAKQPSAREQPSPR